MHKLDNHGASDEGIVAGIDVYGLEVDRAGRGDGDEDWEEEEERLDGNHFDRVMSR